MRRSSLRPTADLAVRAGSAGGVGRPASALRAAPVLLLVRVWLAVLIRLLCWGSRLLRVLPLARLLRVLPLTRLLRVLAERLRARGTARHTVDRQPPDQLGCRQQL